MGNPSPQVKDEFTQRVIISDNITHPLEAMIRPDTDLSGFFVAWDCARKVFDTFDGGLCDVLPIH